MDNSEQSEARRIRAEIDDLYLHAYTELQAMLAQMTLLGSPLEPEDFIAVEELPQANAYEEEETKRFMENHLRTLAAILFGWHEAQTLVFWCDRKQTSNGIELKAWLEKPPTA